ncbi:MAG: hypothetical protein CMO26_02920 [Thiotrichales bacterium]|nr:hypothetical protein [Thiotrichales bacterium]
MKVAVTGGNGQLGRHVVDALEPDHIVTVLDLTDVGTRQPYGPIDLLDLDRVALALAGHDAVIHLGGLDAAIEASDEAFYRTNTLATWNVLQAGVEAGIGVFSLCSSGSAYGFSAEGARHPPDYIPVDEGHRLRASDAYGLSKRVLEQIGRGFSERKGVHVSVLRPVYVAFDPVLPRLVRCKHAQPEPKTSGWQEPLSLLRWVVAPEDVASCFRLSIEQAPKFETFNVTADDTFSATPTRELMQAAYGQSIDERDSNRFDSNPFASPLDNSKAKRVLGWQPEANWAMLQQRASQQ